MIFTYINRGSRLERARAAQNSEHRYNACEHRESTHRNLSETKQEAKNINQANIDKARTRKRHKLRGKEVVGECSLSLAHPLPKHFFRNPPGGSVPFPRAWVANQSKQPVCFYDLPDTNECNTMTGNSVNCHVPA